MSKILVSLNAKEQVPVEPSAVKILNYLVKNYGATKVKSLGSNPYSEGQVLYAVIRSVANRNKLHKDLEAQGWAKSDANRYAKREVTRIGYSYMSSGTAKITLHDEGYVTISGIKKAKRITLPYYD